MQGIILSLFQPLPHCLIDSFLPLILTFIPSPQYSPYNPTTTPSPATTIAPTAAVALGIPPAPPALPAVVAALAAATCNPNAVVTTALPLMVVVTMLVAVVFAAQPDHEVHGGDVPHGPAVQPGQSDGGQAEPPHHAVHG